MAAVNWAISIISAVVLAGQTPAMANVGSRLPRRAPSASEGAGVKPSGLKKVYKGPEGESATLVFLVPPDKNLILIKFDGTGSPWDGKVFLHKIQAVGLGEDYIADINGKDYVTVTMRDAYGRSFALYPPNKADSLPITFSEAETKAVDPNAVWKQYQNDRGR
jgi:hypothetical protein